MRNQFAVVLLVLGISAAGLWAGPSASAGASPPMPNGYWVVGSDGGVFAFGSAGFFGSLGAIRLAKPIVGMALTADAGGYWLVGADGGVFAFGDAVFHGSSGCVVPAKPCGGANSFVNNGIVGIAPTADGGGYWLVAHHGSIFAFGDAVFHGSSGCVVPTTPCGGANSFVDDGIVGIAPTADGGGYWLTDNNGGIFAFGDAVFHGSSGCVDPAKPCGGANSFVNNGIVGIAPTADGGGYWLLGHHGGIFAFGDAAFYGSSGCVDPAKPCGGANSFSVSDLVAIVF